MFGAYCQLLQRLASVEESWSEPVRHLLPEQQRTLLAEVNATEAPVSDKLLPHVLYRAGCTAVLTSWLLSLQIVS